MRPRFVQYMLVMVAGLAVAAGCERPGQGATPKMGGERPPAPVTVAVATTQDVPVYLEKIGRCVPYEHVTIEPQVKGRITAVNFSEGAEVKQGDTLFTIDPRPFEAALAQAKATHAQRIAERDLAKKEFQRVEGIIGTKAISEQDFDAKKWAVAVADAQVDASQAAVDTAKLNLEYCTILSPINGRTGQRLVDVGAVVQENQGALVVIDRVDPIYVDFNVPERELPTIREHMAKGTLKVQVWVPERPETRREGQLTFLDNTVMQAAGTIKLRATLQNADRYFWAGQFVQVRLVLSIKKDAVMVPSAAMQVSQTGPYVYVVNDQSQAELRPVKAGQRHDTLVVIDEGVKAGEKVVVTGQMYVAPGGKVMVVPAGAPATRHSATQPGAEDEDAKGGDQ